MAVYEAHAQDFLKSMITLIHVAPLPPLRAPDLLSVTGTNGVRRRSTFIWEKLVMVHVRYHKSQRQTGDATDNIRFLPPAIGNLLLTFQALVQPLRQIFLRQVKPGALLSPYLWSSLDGEVWQDQAVSKWLSRACARAQVPRFKAAWWRQAAASITKEKFTAKERANFNLEEIAGAEVIDEEGLMVDLAESSNHTFRTFNLAYAGSTTLTISTLLHRAYRASLSWRTLFQVDELLAEEMASGSGGRKKRSWRGGGEDEEEEADGSRILSACKKTRLRSRPLEKESGLLAVARELHNDPDLQLRGPGQRDAMLAVMGPKAAEQVVVVLGTGSGKSLIVMVAAALEGAGTTIMVLPTVALRGNMLERVAKMGIRTILWSPGQTRSAPLVIVSAEAACTEGFDEYVVRLESRQRLDRIVIDECHLTITANDYRKSMKYLGWHARRVRTQTVWLTATLPPDFEHIFTEHNLLVRPRMVRESTNRPNIRYRVRRFKGEGGLRSNVAELVRLYSIAVAEGNGNGIAGGTGARAIVYCQTIELMMEIAADLQCPTYTGDRSIMDEDDKRAAIEQWLGPTGSLAIVATSALSVGFDYPFVRWVIHAGPPRRMTDFSQESGRAGRDGRPAESTILVSAAWRLRAEDGQETAGIDEESMQLYLKQQYCSRAVMSQFLDAREDWRWCMEGEDELCEVCPNHHTEQRPAGLELRLPASKADNNNGEPGDGGDSARAEPRQTMQYTGPDEVLRRTMLQDEILDRFEADMEMMLGCCLQCRMKSRPFDHAAGSCSQRRAWINAKMAVMKECSRSGKPWMPDFAVCFMCYMPQRICRRADPDAEDDDGTRLAADQETAKQKDRCRYKDMILPLCVGAFLNVGRRTIITKSFRSFGSLEEYMRWLGEACELGGTPCVQATRVAARLLSEF
jgi:hypothetical protein